MYTHELKKSLEDAEATIRAANNCANDIAYLIRNRLQSGNVSQSTLISLKKELQRYNMHTGRWK